MRYDLMASKNIVFTAIHGVFLFENIIPCIADAGNREGRRAGPARVCR